jgi:[protein-PII] uridylyltransferase
VSAPTVAYVEERAALLARPGLSGPGRRSQLSELTDDWLAQLVAAVSDAGAKGTSGMALVAVGGYGRRELSPGSDVDVLLLHSGSRRDVATVAERIWYPVWDSGVRLDHSVRTVTEARRVASGDLPAALGLLDARHIAGDERLTDTLRSALLDDWRRAARRRLPELLELCRERGRRHGELAFLLEPDLKEARGGLRDVVTLKAVSMSWVADSPHGQLEAARDRLLDVRDALHVVTGRASDRLLLQEQDAVAEMLGLLDGDALLREVAAAGRTISYASDVTWRRVEQLVGDRSRRRRRGTPPDTVRRPLADGVVEQEGEAVLARDARPDRDPQLILRSAAAAAQAGLPLAPHTVERLALDSPPMPVPWPAEARDHFVRLLGAGPAAVPVLEALDQVGLVERLLPDWGRVRCRPQRNPIHRFTVDRHLVEAAMHAAALTRRVSRPDLLLVGALLHDIGKGWPGDHTQAGVVVVHDVAPRMGFNPRDTEVLATLVRYHLLLPETATRRDLDDPVTIVSVARAVETPETLDLLHALSEADGLATGPAAWNDWKAGLVAELAERVRVLLAGATPEPVPPLTPQQKALADAGELAVAVEPGPHSSAVTVVAPHRPDLLATVAGVLALHRLSVHGATAQIVGKTAVQTWSALPDFGGPPDPVALREDIRRAVTGRLDVARRVARREAAYPPRPGVPVPPPRAQVVPDASETATVLEVRAHDQPGLLHRLATAICARGVDIRSARVSTLGAEAVDVFYLVGADGAPLPEQAAAELATAVRAALR